jgi:predicted nucleic acid-binding protein
MILVDSNVIIDVLTEDAAWRGWSERALIDAADRDEIAINPIIYAEVAARSKAGATRRRSRPSSAFASRAAGRSASS